MSLGGECRRCGQHPGYGCIECDNCGAAWPLCDAECEADICAICGGRLAPVGRSLLFGVGGYCEHSDSLRHLFPGELSRCDRYQDERDEECFADDCTVDDDGPLLASNGVYTINAVG